MSDQPENPEFAHTQGNFNVSELVDNNSANIPMQARIKAYDQDSVDLGALAYSIVAGEGDDGEGDDALPFEITSELNDETGQTEGRLWLKAGEKIDFEEIPAYRVHVRVTDSTGRSSLTDLELDVQINDENEPPVFASDERVFELEENSGGGVEIANLAVIDPDGDSIAYTMTAGDSDLFQLNGATGQLTTKSGADFDYESAISYTVSVTAREAITTDQYLVSTDLTVNIADLNDMSVVQMSPNKLTTSGSEQVTFLGSDIGPLDSRSSSTTIEAYYVGGDGVRYYAKNCVISTPNTEFTCETVPGVGQNHQWNITVIAPNTASWTVQAAGTTSYKAPVIESVVNSTSMPTAGGSQLVLMGRHFGPDFKDCRRRCVDGVTFACGNECKNVDDSCELSAGTGTACDEFPDWFVSDVAQVTYGPSEELVEKLNKRPRFLPGVRAYFVRMDIQDFFHKV